MPISLLSFWRYEETALKYLKSTSTDVLIRDNEGRSLLEYAAECNNLELFKLIYNASEHDLGNIDNVLYNAVMCGRIKNYILDRILI